MPYWLQTISCADYKRGKHFRWEAELHAYEAKVLEFEGVSVSLSSRGIFVDSYLARVGVPFAHEIVTCHICSENWANGELTGTDVFKMPEFVKTQLTKFQNFGLTLRGD